MLSAWSLLKFSCPNIYLSFHIIGKIQFSAQCHSNMLKTLNKLSNSLWICHRENTCFFCCWLEYFCLSFLHLTDRVSSQQVFPLLNSPLKTVITKYLADFCLCFYHTLSHNCQISWTLGLESMLSNSGWTEPYIPR